MPKPVSVDDHGHRRLAGPIVSMPSATPATSRSPPLGLDLLLDRIQVDGEGSASSSSTSRGGAARRRTGTAQEASRVLQAGEAVG
jgi:hypothetical protein